MGTTLDLLPLASSLNSSDMLYVRKSDGTNERVTWAQIMSAIGGTIALPMSISSPTQLVPGTLDAAHGGLFLKNHDGTELLRIVAMDSDIVNDWGSGNTYIGFEAGKATPSNNIDAGYYNTAVGHQALKASTTGS